MLGRGAHGAVVFAPLDIESILSDLSLPTETKLLPDPDPEYAAVDGDHGGAFFFALQAGERFAFLEPVPTATDSPLRLFRLRER